jgi:uncharacterized protein YutE (UPF0331/DUF86 family)
MKIDKNKIQKFLSEITKNSYQLRELIENNHIKQDSIELKAVKYILIELAEAMSNTLQHILVKVKGVPVSGYVDTVVKSNKEGIISDSLFKKLKPFFDFRNSLIHRYWIMKDDLLIENLLAGKDDFDAFVSEIEGVLKSLKTNESDA